MQFYWCSPQLACWLQEQLSLSEMFFVMAQWLCDMSVTSNPVDLEVGGHFLPGCRYA